MHAPISAEFRALTKELLAIRREKVVPLLKAGFKAARAELLGAKRNPGGLNVIWRSANNDLLQIVTNFSGQPLPRPPLIEGEYLWGSDPARGHLYLHPTEIIVRRGFDAAAG